MLTDKDKWDLMVLWGRSMDRGNDDNFLRSSLGFFAHMEILDFIIDHPDVCAAEIKEFTHITLSRAEFNRLEAMYARPQTDTM